MDATLQQEKKKKKSMKRLEARLSEQEISPYIKFIIPTVKVRIAAAMFLLTLNCTHNAVRI